MKTRLLIIGGVAAGATAAARARRVSEDAEITVLERGPFVSYANCGLPYFVSGDIAAREALILQTPGSFAERYAVDVQLSTEALEIDRPGKRVRARGADGERWYPYDRLLLAQGGNPVVPPVPGADAPHVFRLWTVPDMDRIHAWIAGEKPRSAVVVGGGFIGLEMAEAFRKRGLETTVVELLPTVMAVMDREFGNQIAEELRRSGVGVITGAGVKAVLPGEKQVELSDGRRIPAELVLFSVGVRPELALARAAGLALGPTGALLVDEHLATSDPDIFAAGDMIEVVHRVSGKRARIPLAGPANRQGRIAASNALGVPMAYRGALGTSVVKIFEATAGMTGLSERAAREAGFDVGAAVTHKDHHAGYYPGAQGLSLKLVYDRKTGRLLGGQCFGRAGVDKRIDVLATALQAGMTVAELTELDLAYAPPYSSANDPLNLVAMVAENDRTGFSPVITAAALREALASPNPPVLVDVRRPGEYRRRHLKGAINASVDGLRGWMDRIPRGRRLALYCGMGLRGHVALRALRGHGYDDVVNVSGGMQSLLAEGGFEWEPS